LGRLDCEPDCGVNGKGGDGAGNTGNTDLDNLIDGNLNLCPHYSFYGHLHELFNLLDHCVFHKHGIVLGHNLVDDDMHNLLTRHLMCHRHDFFSYI
jgi:hypothetical protein